MYENGKLSYTYTERIGQATSNIAEWHGAIKALGLALISTDQDVELRMDSRLVVQQLLGAWRVKNEGLKPLAAEGKRLRDALLKRGVRLKIKWVPREKNECADTAAGACR
jgi:probable phosphoglycerate mutase